MLQSVPYTVVRYLGKRAEPFSPPVRDYGCDGCNGAWPWLLDHDGRPFVFSGDRHHITPAGAFERCTHPGLQLSPFRR